MTRAILLTNLGSPKQPDVPAVRSYLNEFLMDPAVIRLPWPLRRLLVTLICLTRPVRSAEAYASIWMEREGSPLIHYSEALRQVVSEQINLPVRVAMRYGEPSFEQALGELAEIGGVDELLVIPLYPQFAESTTGTTLTHLRRLAAEHLPDARVQIRQAFFDDARWLDLYAAHIREHLPADFDHLLFSYHGLPEQHLKAADPTGSHCLASPDCCEQASAAHATCYRHQCRRTSEALAERIGLDLSQWSMSYQSRLGRQQWLEPATDATVLEFAQNGIQHLAVACPAFVADNLETLEEIGIQANEAFREAGGQQTTLIPCLNNNPDWAALIADWARDDWSLLDDSSHPYNLVGTR